MTRRVPITRLEKFFGQDDFALEIEMGREYLNGDLNFTLVLYSVDIQKTNKDDVYGEVINGGIQFQPPVEFRALVRIEEATNQYINGSRVMQNEPGNYISIDRETYQNPPKHVRVVDGKLKMLRNSQSDKLVPSKVGTPCDSTDVCVVVGDQTDHIKWNLKTYDPN